MKFFFSDSIMINFNNLIHFSKIWEFEFSPSINSLHFSSKFGKKFVSYILNKTFIAWDKIFSDFILNVISHNLSRPFKSSIFSKDNIFILILFLELLSLSLSSSCWVSWYKILSLFNSKKSETNKFISSKVTSFSSFLDIKSNNFCLTAIFSSSFSSPPAALSFVIKLLTNW